MLGAPMPFRKEVRFLFSFSGSVCPIIRLMAITLLALSLLVTFSAPSSAAAADFEGLVVAISDGDTVTLLQGNDQVKVRLWGIDAPEKRQAFGTRAQQHLGNLVHGKR